MNPTLRLAVIGTGREIKTFRSPTLRLAHAPGAQGDNFLESSAELDPSSIPALLISYVYLKPFEEARADYTFRNWSLDSGAFSAYASGTKIEIEEYIATCHRLLAEDPQLVEVFALDVIGDWRASLKNTETMWKAGVPAIPCYHLGEPEDALLEMARDYPKIALGGVAARGLAQKLDWAAQCFARVWPKKIHGFGFGSGKYLLSLPFHSVDATSWELRPCKFGSWASLGRLRTRGSDQNLRAEVEHYLKVERQARMRWSKEMALLDAQ